MSVFSITVCSQVYSFQKRFFWQLSSLCQQLKLDDIDLRVRASIYKNDPFFLWNYKIKNIFQSKLNIDFIEYFEKSEESRGHVRNIDLKNSNSDWILFTDADMCFSSLFFYDLRNRIRGIVDKNCLITTHRYGTSFKGGYELVEREKYDDVIKDSYGKANKYIVKKTTRLPGAGYFQLVRKDCKDIYTNNPDRDGQLNNLTEKYKSDIYFRKNLKIVKIEDLQPIIHINHYRTRQGQIDKKDLL